MTKFFDWLRAAPPTVIPVATAVLAASVALMVAVLTQWILGRRTRSDLLTKKLEELYLLVLQWIDDATATKLTVDELLASQPLSQETRAAILSLVKQPRADRRVSMYINLYFPRLNRFNNDIFNANRGFSRVVRELAQGVETKAVDIQRAYLQLWVLLEPLRSEILENHAYLTRSKLIRPSYKECASDTDGT